MPEHPREALPLPLEFALPRQTVSLRLDAALAARLPHFGLRARRRLWRWCRILVNGKDRAPGFLVNGGDCIRIEEKEQGSVASAFMPRGVRLVRVLADFAVLDKPAGLHSAHIAASPEPSLEGLLPLMWPDLHEQWQQANALLPPNGTVPPPELLLTRLDKETSGLVLAARHERAAERFRLDEARGLVRKTYLALLAGRLHEPLRVKSRLKTADTSQSAVYADDDPDPVRHSDVEAIGFARLDEGCVSPDADGACTLARVTIRRGARHQIRAHLAHAGFPLAGDLLYGAPASFGSRFFLHHGAIDLPAVKARCLPAWLGAWPAERLLPD